MALATSGNAPSPIFDLACAFHRTGKKFPCFAGRLRNDAIPGGEEYAVDSGPRSTFVPDVEGFTVAPPRTQPARRGTQSPLRRTSVTRPRGGPPQGKRSSYRGTYVYCDADGSI